MVLNIDIVKCLGKVTKNPTLQEKNGKIFFKKNHLAQTLDFVQEKAGQNIIALQAVESARSDLQSALLGRICNPTAISMSICNAENGKAKADYKSLY